MSLRSLLFSLLIPLCLLMACTRAPVVTLTVASSTKTPSQTLTPSSFPTSTVLPSPTVTTSPFIDKIAFLAVPRPPDFMPDGEGERIANLYLAESGTDSKGVWHIEPVLTTLTNTFGLATSPDGKRLAFSGVLKDTNGDGLIRGYDDLSGIYVFTLSDGSLQRVNEIGGSVFSWSPDGQSIAYVLWDTLSSEGAIQASSLYVVNLADLLSHQLIPNVPGVIDEIAWSPDNRYIAISARPRLFLFDLLTKQIAEIPMSMPSCDLHMAWSPNGQKLAFVPCHNSPTLFLLNANTLTIQNLIEATYISPPTWSPDGQYLAIGLIQNDVQKADIFTIEVIDRKLHNLSNNPEGDSTPLWSPDGQWILFSSDRKGKPMSYVISRNGGEAYFVLDRQQFDTGIEGLIWLPKSHLQP